MSVAIHFNTFPQVDKEGNLQHLVAELVSSSLYVSASFGPETVSLVLPLMLTPEGILEANITITVGQGHLEVVNSDCEAGICSVNGTAKSQQASLMLDGSLYIGGLPRLTPFIRSKLHTVSYYRGCLGVSNNNNNNI